MKRIKKILLVLALVLTQGMTAGPPISVPAYEFLKRLRVDKPITSEEMGRYFVDLNMPNTLLLMQMGYLDQTGKWKLFRKMPKYSPLGELMRLKASLFGAGNVESFIATEGDRLFLREGRTEKTNLYKHIVLFPDLPEDRTESLKTIIFTYNVHRNMIDFLLDR